MPKLKGITKEEVEARKKAYNKEYNHKYYLAKTKAKREALRKITPPKEKEVIEKVCEVCGKTFTTTSKKAKYCSKECKHIHNLQYQKIYRKTPEFRAKMREYYKSENYKETRKKYASSEKGKATLKRYVEKQRKTKAEKISNIKNILENYKGKIAETDLKAILKNLK